jgi:chondroitin AC lyase
LVNVSNTTATGNWRQITHQSWATEEPVKKDLFTLWFHHGTKPSAATYQYIVVPSANASALDSYKRKSPVSIISNTAEMQAVQHKGLGITQVAFYKAGTINLSNTVSLTSESPCLVLVKMAGNSISEIAVSDPTHKLKQLELRVNVPVNLTAPNHRSSWNSSNKTSTLQVQLPTEGMAGSSVVIDLKTKKA